MGNTETQVEQDVIDVEWRVVPQIIEGQPEPAFRRSSLVALGLAVVMLGGFTLSKAFLNLSPTNVLVTVLPLGPVFISCICATAYVRWGKPRSLGRGFLDLFLLGLVLYGGDHVIQAIFDGHLHSSPARVWTRGRTSNVPAEVIEGLKVFGLCLPSIWCYGWPALKTGMNRRFRQRVVVDYRL